MNKQEQEIYNRVLETGKKYEKLYTDLYNKTQDLKTFLNIKSKMTMNMSEKNFCCEILNFLKDSWQAWSKGDNIKLLKEIKRNIKTSFEMLLERG